MPEGPEIHLNTDLYLRKYLEGKILKDIEILSGKYLKKKPANFDRFVEDLPAKVSVIGNKGKFTWLELENGWFIGTGFGMSGRLSLDEEATHNRLVLVGGTSDIYYSDTRNFGNWFFWDNVECLEKKLNELGPDILDNDKLSKKELVELFRKHDRWEITQALMSQKILAGGGNYIKAEGLYETEIYPYAKVSDLSDEILYKLYQNIVKIARKSYSVQMDGFLNGDPYQNYQQYMKVYNHDLDPLGNKVIRSTNTKDKRTTWWVKEVQTIGKK